MFTINFKGLKIAMLFKEKYNIFAITGLIILSVGIYANSFKNEFVWDDASLVENNVLIKDARNIPKIFTTYLFAGVDSPSNFYRPIQNLSYLFDYSLWKLNPFGYHLTNTVIHAANAMLLYLLIFTLFENILFALIASILFSIHPIHTEAVAYISGRADLLGALFGLISILMFLRYRTTKTAVIFHPYYITSLVSFIFALLSKEVSVVVPLLIIVCDYVNSFRQKRVFRSYLSFFLILLIYGILRYTLLYFPSEKSIYADLSLFPRLLTTFYAILQYFKIIIFPFNLHMERSVALAVSFFEPRIMSSAMFLSCLVFLVLKNRTKWKAFSFGIGWFFISLLPVSNIVPLNSLMAEHWLYLPSIGLFLVMAVAINKLIQSKFPKILSYLFAASIFVYFSFLTVKQNFIWRDGITLYQHTLKFSPFSASVHYNLGNSFDKLGMFDKAISEYEKAISIRPQYPDAYNNLGLMYFKKSNYKEAVNFFKKSLEIASGDFKVLINLAESYRHLEDFDSALETYEKTKKIKPTNVQPYINSGVIYTLRNDYARSSEEYKMALSLDADAKIKAKIYFNLGLSYAQLGQIDLAKKAWDSALRFDSGLKQAKENLDKITSMGY